MCLRSYEFRCVCTLLLHLWVWACAFCDILCRPEVSLDGIPQFPLWVGVFIYLFIAATHTHTHQTTWLMSWWECFCLCLPNPGNVNIQAVHRFLLTSVSRVLSPAPREFCKCLPASISCSVKRKCCPCFTGAWGRFKKQWIEVAEQDLALQEY